MPDYEARAEKAADALRAVLLALASGGLTAAYTLHNAFGALLFVAALGCMLRSWFLAKDRALRRKRDPNYGVTKWSPRASWLWDTIAAWLMIVGAALLAIFSLV